MIKQISDSKIQVSVVQTPWPSKKKKKKEKKKSLIFIWISNRIDVDRERTDLYEREVILM